MICRACRTQLRTLRLPLARANAARPASAAIRGQTGLRAPPATGLFQSPLRQTLSPRHFSSAPSSAHDSDVPPVSTNEAEAAIASVLTSALEPSDLVVRDVSGGCGSMYAIEIASPKFRDLSILKQQRLVNSALGDMVKGWHGVQIRTKATPV